MRITVSDSAKLGEAIGQVTGMQTRALKNAHCSIREIQTALGREEPIFDHLLNFQQFGGGGAAKGGTGL